MKTEMIPQGRATFSSPPPRLRLTRPRPPTQYPLLAIVAQKAALQEASCSCSPHGACGVLYQPSVGDGDGIGQLLPARVLVLATPTLGNLPHHRPRVVVKVLEMRFEMLRVMSDLRAAIAVALGSVVVTGTRRIRQQLSRKPAPRQCAVPVDTEKIQEIPMPPGRQPTTKARGATTITMETSCRRQRPSSNPATQVRRLALLGASPHHIFHCIVLGYRTLLGTTCAPIQEAFHRPSTSASALDPVSRLENGSFSPKATRARPGMKLMLLRYRGAFPK